MSPRPVLAVALLAASALALSGCVILPPGGTPGPGPDPQPAPGASGAATCDGGELHLDQPGEYRIGDCDELHIAGTGVEVVAGDVGLISIRGDANEVGYAGFVGSVDDRGARNEIRQER